MTRMLFLLISGLWFSTPGLTQGVESALDGVWYNPQQSGQGIVFRYLADSQTVFGGWFTFDPVSGERTWWTLQGQGSGRSVAVGVFASSGGVFAQPSQVETVQSGSGVVTVVSCDDLTFEFAFDDGPGGALGLTRIGAADNCQEPAPVNRLDNQGTIAITGVDILTMDEPSRLLNHTIVIDGDEITAVFPRGTEPVPADAVVISGQGGLVLPGLVDAHTHLATNVVEFLGTNAPQAEIERAGHNQLWLYLAKGVTTIINNGDFGAPLPVWASQVVAGTLPGPTIYAAKYARGGATTCDGGPANVTVSTASQARGFVRQAQADGYHYIKTYNCTPGPAIEAILDEGQRAGMTVIGHLPQTLDPQTTLESGMAMVAHAEAFVWTVTQSSHNPNFLPVIRELVVGNQTWVTGTLSILELIAQVWGGNQSGIDAYWAREDTAWMHPTERNLHQRSITSNRFNPVGSQPGGYDPRRNFVRDIVADLQSGGARLLIGTDSPTVLGVAGFSMHDELLANQRAGLGTHTVLSMATRNGGDFVSETLAIDLPFGRIAPGYRADLLLLQQDFGSDLGAIEGSLRGVMARGRWYSRPLLDQQLDRIRFEYQ